MELYHQTTRSHADAIWKCGGKFIRGSGGNAGAASYFAKTRRETEWKAVPEGPGERVLLKCKVQLGEIRHEFHKSETPLLKELRDISFRDMMRFDGNTIQTVGDDDVTEVMHMNPSGPKDSIHLKRGMSSRGKSGDEVVIYSWDQIKVLEEVDRDPL